MRVRVHTLAIKSPGVDPSCHVFATEAELTEHLRQMLRENAENSDSLDDVEGIEDWSHRQVVNQWNEDFADDYLTIDHHDLVFEQMEIVNESELEDA